MSTSLKIKVIGTAQDGGVPQPNCKCENCIDAYKDASLRRNAASLALLVPDEEQYYLIDATPDFKEQLYVINRDHPTFQMGGIFLTHAHIGHYTGLMFLGKEALSTKKLPVFSGEKMASMLREHAPWKQLVELNNIELQSLFEREKVTVGDSLTVTPIEVPHRNEFSETFAFLLEGPSKKLLYIPDIDHWRTWDEGLSQLVATVDYCLLDATFYSADEVAGIGRDPKEIPHPYITETMDLLQDLVNGTKLEVYFTHFNHSNPVLNINGEAYRTVINRGFKLASEGMEIDL
jgi:pyrroloquinoline quinone biosynthesis protein B